MKALSALLRVQVGTVKRPPHEAAAVRSTFQWSHSSPGLSQDTVLYPSSSGSRHSPGVRVVWVFLLL